MRLADGLVIAAPSSGSGKTVITLALLAALRRRGIKVRSAPRSAPTISIRGFTSRRPARPASTSIPGRCGPERLADARGAGDDADLVLVEGVMGLFDGPPGGGGSTADLAAMLGLPVVLVVDAARQGQSIAALVAGFARHRPGIVIAGVIAQPRSPAIATAPSSPRPSRPAACRCSAPC